MVKKNQIINLYHNPFFSIILPTYNRAFIIKKAIESVLNQTFIDWELLIIDDGSTDNTKETIEFYTDQRINYYYQKHQERSAARNNGIERAKGEYICFLDSDDYFLPEHLNELYKKITEWHKPISFIYTAIRYEREGKIELGDNHEFQFNNNIEFVIQKMIATPQVCIHNQILLKHKFNTAFHIGEDLELWVRIVTEYPILFINSPTIITLIHENRSVNVKKNNIAKQELKVLKWIFTNYKNEISYRVRNKKMSKTYFSYAKYYIYNHKKINALFFLIVSILTRINDPLTKHKILLLIKLLLNRRIIEYT